MQWTDLRAGALADSPTEAVRKGLRFLGTLAWVALIAATVPQLFRPAGHTAATWTGAVLMALHEAVVLAGLVFKPRSRRAFRIAAVLFVAAFILLLPHGHSIRPVNQWTPGYLGLPWAIWATIVLPGRRYVPVLVATFGGMTLVDGLWVLTRLQSHNARDLLVSAWILFPAIMVMLFGDALRRVALRLERQIGERERTVRQSQEQQAELDARAEAARMLHDHVLHALHAVSHTGGVITAAMARDECDTALGALSRPRRAEETISVRELVEQDPVVQAMGATVTGNVGEVPMDVAVAMSAAVHEALSNAQRHAGAVHVHVEMEQLPTSRRVVVRDDGSGFNPDRVPESRLGVRRSIKGRLEDVGGAATIESQPGNGTTVELTWPRESTEHTDPLWTTGTHRMMRRLLVRSAWPGLVATLVSIPLMLRETGWGMTIVALVQVLTGAVYSWLLLRRPVRTSDVVAVLGVSVGSWIATLAIGPDLAGIIDIYDLWPAWACPALLHLVVLQLPVRQGIRVMIAWSVVMVSAVLVRHPSGFDWVRLNPVVSTSIGEGLLTLGALAIFEGLSIRHAAERELVDRSRLALARMRHASQLKDFWSQQVTGEALPLMRGISDGSMRPDDPAVQRRARLLEATLRDELLLGSDQPDMLRVLAHLRAEGWEVATPSVGAREWRFLEPTALWLGAIGSPARAGQEARVTLSSGAATLVVLDPADAQIRAWRELADEVGAELDDGPGFARLRVHLPVRAMDE